MNGWNKVKAALDAALGLTKTPTASKVKKLRQGFDNTTQEHVVWIEYRCKAGNSASALPNRIGEARDMIMLRELLALA